MSIIIIRKNRIITVSEAFAYTEFPIVSYSIYKHTLHMCTHIKYKLYTKLYLYLFYKYGVYTNIHAQSKYTHKNNDISTYISNTAATIVFLT